MFDVARVYGKDTLLMIHWFGTDYLPRFFALKGRLDAYLNKMRFVPRNLVDRTMQFLSRMLPEALPVRLLAFRQQFEHHLMLRVEEKSAGETEALLQELFGGNGWFVCDAAEAKKAMLHRFVCAGAAVRYQAVHEDEVEDIVALDIALRRNDEEWLEKLPPRLEKDIVAKLYYGHFFCHVFHQDYILRKGSDAKLLKQELLQLLNQRGRRISCRAQCWSPLRSETAAARVLRIAGPDQFLQSRHRQNLRAKAHHAADWVIEGASGKCPLLAQSGHHAAEFHVRFRG